MQCVCRCRSPPACRDDAPPPLYPEGDGELGVQPGGAGEYGEDDAGCEDEGPLPEPGVASRAPAFIRAAIAFYSSRPETSVDLRLAIESSVADIRASFGPDVLSANNVPALGPHA